MSKAKVNALDKLCLSELVKLPENVINEYLRYKSTPVIRLVRHVQTIC